MKTRFERWIRSKLLAITAFTPSNCVPLAAQSRELPVPYSSPAKMTVGVLRAMTALTPRSCVPLAAQSRLEPVPYYSPPNTTVGVPSAM